MIAAIEATYEARFARNSGIVLNQEALRGATVSIAGCGRAGAAAGIALARMGVGAFRLADPDVISVANISGMVTAGTSRIGMNKAAALASDIRDINPDVRLEVIEEGVTEENASAFVTGSSLALDAIDFYRADLSILLHAAARKAGLVVLVGVPVAWNAFLFKFEPTGLSLEQFMGLPIGSAASAGTVIAAPVSSFCPEIPGYIDGRLVLAVARGEIPIPSVAPGVLLVGSMLAAATYFELSGCKSLRAVPGYYAAEDLFEKRAKRRSLISHFLEWLLGALRGRRK